MINYSNNSNYHHHHNNNLLQCPICFTSQSILSCESINEWQTINYWIYYINEALDQFGPNPSGITCANVRKRAKELANIPIEVLRKGYLQSFGSINLCEDEDLGGPGFFPLREALIDAGCMHYEVNNRRYKCLGQWTTFKSSEGTEREIWKLSWGSPPWAICDGCTHLIPLSSGLTCEQCYEINPQPIYWCNETCKLLNQKYHFESCKRNCDLWEEYQKMKEVKMREKILIE